MRPHARRPAPLEHLVYVPEGDWTDPGNYSGTPLYFGRALARACGALGLQLRIVQVPELINTEALWALVTAAVERRGEHGHALALTRPQRDSAATRTLLRDLRGVRGHADAVGPVRDYLRRFERLTGERLRRCVDARSAVLCLNTMNPPWRGELRTWYYLDAPLAPLYFDPLVGFVRGAGAAPELVEVFASLERDAIARARGLFFFSRFAAAACARAYPGASATSLVVGAGANLASRPRYRPRSFARPLRLLFVGRDLSLKGGELLLDAAARLDPARFQLTLVTEPRFHPRPEARPASTRFLAPVGKRRLTELYAEHDIFVFPTRLDAFGIVVCEAMAHGMPVIATPVRALPEILGEPTALFDPYVTSAAELVLLLEGIAGGGDVAALRAIGRRNFVLARQRFDWRLVAERMLAAMLGDGAASGDERPGRPRPRPSRGNHAAA